MNNILRQIIIGLAVLALTACGGSGGDGAKIEENGLTKDINHLVPKEILEKMISLGMPINKGGTPPKMEGIYQIKPFILQASNVPGDAAGDRFTYQHVEFYKQNNKKLTIKINFQSSGDESGHGIGSFIVGTDNKFTIFSRIDGILEGEKFVSVDVYSGIITDSGIADYHMGTFMIDDKGDPKNIMLNNGQGRIAYDADGISEKIDNLNFKRINNPEGVLSETQYPNLMSSLNR